VVDRLNVASANHGWQTIFEMGWSGHVKHSNFGGHRPYLQNSWS